MLNSPHGNLVKKIALSGVILLLFSLGCISADVPPGDGSTTDDHGNARATATPVTSGMQVAGNIETGDDQDYFSIEANGAGILRATAIGDVNTIGHLYDGFGRELAANDDDGEGMNFNVSAQIASAGTYYLRVTSSGTGTGIYRLTVTLIPDDHGNTRASATPAMIDVPINGEINPGTDTDYFSVVVAGAGTLRATTTGGTNTMGAIYDSGGMQLAADDNSGTDTNFDVSHNITAPGTYYVRVTSAGSGTGMYRLTVTFMPDDHGNTQATATRVISGMQVAGDIKTGDDQDWFSIQATGAGTIRAVTTGTTNTMGAIYNNSGAVLAANDDGGEDMNFELSVQVTSAGTYYVRVTSAGMGTGMYSLTATFIPDDHGNNRARATRITSGMEIAGNIETGDDQDWFSIVVTAGVRLRAVTTGMTNTIGTIYNNSEAVLATNDDDGEGMNFNVSARITSTGTYYVRVTSSGTGTGMYELTVTSIPDDYGNTRASATPVTIGMPIDGEIDPGTDIDYFSIQVSSTDLTGVDFLTLTASTTGDVDTMGTLYDSSGNELASDDNGGTGMNFELSTRVATAGTYYVRVAGSDTGMYSLTVTSMAGDHSDMRDTSATSITIGTAINGHIDPNTDEDYFSIEVTSAELSGRASLILRAATTGSLDTIGHLYDSGGMELAMNDDSAPSNMNFSISHSITTAGTYYIRVTGSTTGAYSLSVALDDHGDVRTTATLVTSGTAVNGNLETALDQDWFSIVVSSTDLTGKDFLTLTASTTGGTNTMGAIYDSDGMQLAADSNSGASTNFNVSYNITSAGTYYVRVTSEGSASGMYTLTVTVSDGDYGNTRGTAAQVTLATAIAGHINPGTDEDYFSISVSSTDLAGIDFLTLRATTTGSLDTVGHIYNIGGTELATNDNGVSIGMNFDVSARITSTGTYYVKVSSSGSGTGMYGLTVTTTTGDHSDMRDTSATSITSGTVINGHIDPNTDEDHFAIVVSSTELTSIDFVLLRASTTGTTDTIGTIYDSSGMELATDDDEGTGMNFDVSTRITTAGTYYIKVASESMDTGMYRLTVTTATGDHGNTRDSATPIMSPAAITGNISPDTDVDYFSIEVTNTDLASADTFVLSASITGGLNTSGELYDSGGTLLVFNSALSSNLNFEISYNITSAGTYYVKVLTRLVVSEMYSLTITAAGRDHGDDRDSATPAALTTAITGKINPDTDEDYFSIEVDSGALNDVDVIILRATTTGTTNTIGTIYDSDGRELASDDDGGTGMNFDASARIINGGTYYFKVASVGSGMGDYSLTVTATSADHGNDIPSATPLKNGERALGLIGETDSPDDPGTDVDYFSIEVTRAGTLTAITAQFTLTSGTLYNSGGTALVTDQRDSTTHNVNISYTIMPADIGTYYLKVSAATATTYDLIVALDSHSDVLNHMAVSGDDDFATPVTSGTAVAGDIAPLDDIDYFQITVAGAGTLRATTTSSIRTLGYLYDSSGNELANDTARSGTGGNFDLSHSITTAGTYYIKVDGELGAYSLTVTFSP